jgi:hypothetical protein
MAGIVEYGGDFNREIGESRERQGVDVRSSGLPGERRDSALGNENSAPWDLRFETKHKDEGSLNALEGWLGVADRNEALEAGMRCGRRRDERRCCTERSGLRGTNSFGKSLHLEITDLPFEVVVSDDAHRAKISEVGISDANAGRRNG